MTQWQPIETAPQDGTPVLLFLPKGVQDRRPEIEEVCPNITIGFWREARWQMTEMDDPCSPTHWMPLPPAPQPQAAS